MLEEALRLYSKGFKVYVFFNTENTANYYRKYLMKKHCNTSIKCSVLPKDFTYSDCISTPPGTFYLLDHGAIEARWGHIINHWLKFTESSDEVFHDSLDSFQ